MEALKGLDWVGALLFTPGAVMVLGQSFCTPAFFHLFHSLTYFKLQVSF